MTRTSCREAIISGGDRPAGSPHAYAAVPHGSATCDEDGRQLTVGEWMMCNAG
jgi:hypothetical protein